MPNRTIYIRNEDIDKFDALKDRGEDYRQKLGIDGTAGDAQDVPHAYKADGDNSWCLACGLSAVAKVHSV